jgi:hypothetical protein
MMKWMATEFFRRRILLLGFLLLTIFLAPYVVRAATVDHKVSQHEYPKLANYYLHTPITSDTVAELARWDILVLSPQAQDNSRAALKKLRELNPNIVLLVYVPSEEFPLTYYDQWSSDPNGVWYRLLRGITSDMWLLDSGGRHVTFWERNWMLNVSNYKASGLRWNEYLSSFVADDLLASGLWDGVFYDNVFTDISWISNDVDLNRNGFKDSTNAVKRDWPAGMNTLFDLTRKKVGEDIIIVGNGDRGYYPSLNGLYFENFTKFSSNYKWEDKMYLYGRAAEETRAPQTNIIGNNTVNTGQRDDYQRVRYGLTSALLEDGYYGFDFGDQGHSQRWWYDEYNVSLGNPINQSSERTRSLQSYAPGVWQRSFQNGLVLVNSTDVAQNVNLSSDFEKIHGTQDTAVNDGGIISEMTLAANDGIVLLKTFAELDEVIARNGDFVRFINKDGERVRNGFFVSDPSYQGGDTVLKKDLNGDGKKDTIVVSGNKLRVWRHDGQPYQSTYPYGAQYHGELHIDVSDIDSNGKEDIIIAPDYGYNKPLKFLTYDGVDLQDDWYPYGTRYAGGYSLAVGDVTGDGASEIVIGAGRGSQPLVSVYSLARKRIKSWQPYERSFRGGVRLAVGDVNGDGKNEVVVGPGPGKKPQIKIFDKAGTLLFKQFTAYSSFVNTGVDIAMMDVDFDGADDILIFSRDVGL